MQENTISISDLRSKDLSSLAVCYVCYVTHSIYCNHTGVFMNWKHYPFINGKVNLNYPAIVLLICPKANLARASL